MLENSSSDDIFLTNHLVSVQIVSDIRTFDLHLVKHVYGSQATKGSYNTHLSVFYRLLGGNKWNKGGYVVG